MSEVLFDGKTLTLYKGEDQQNNEGVILACGNSHMFLDYEATSELIKGLNQIAYELYKTRSELYQ
jgi:hypothetical protein